MSTKIECDGCGEQTSHPAYSNWSRVNVQIKKDDDEVSPQYDLCRSCTNKFERSLPPQWPRVAVAPPSDYRDLGEIPF